MGKAIAEKIDELLTTGKLEFLEKLKQEIPASLADWLQVPGLGPKKIALIWKTLNITALSELEAAAKNGSCATCPAWAQNLRLRSLKGLHHLSRRSGRIPLGRAYPLAQEIITTLKKVKGVVDAATRWKFKKDAFHSRRPGYFGRGKRFIRCDGGVCQICLV